MRRGLLSVLFALGLVLNFSGMVLAMSPGGDDSGRIPSTSTGHQNGPALTLSYAQIIDGGSPVYANPTDAAAGIGPTNWLQPGFVFVSLANSSPVASGGQLWYPLYEGGWVPSSHALPYAASAFHGIELSRQPYDPFAWVLWDSPISAAPGAPPTPDALHFTRYSVLTLLDQQNVNGVMWYRVGDNEWLSQYRLGIVAASKRPDAIGPGDKWIEVNLTEQTLAAYEGDRMVYATLVASGLPNWDTTPGLFQIYDKVKMERMTGEPGKPDYYYLQDIPWIMYFDNDQALHTAYWHDGFGSPHSHGCVNLPPEDAMWLFNWSTPVAGPDNHTNATPDNPGTWVWVHY